MSEFNGTLRSLAIVAAGEDGDGDAEWFLQFAAGPGDLVEFARLNDLSVGAADSFTPDVNLVQYVPEYINSDPGWDTRFPDGNGPLAPPDLNFPPLWEV